MSDIFAEMTQEAESYGKRLDFLYGKAEVSGKFVCFPGNGQRKREWTEADGADKKQGEVTIHVTAIDAQNLTRPQYREILAASAEFAKIVWPSLRELGCKTVKDIDGKYVKLEIVPSGRKPYTNASGVEVTPTTFKFHAIFASEAEATAAFEQDMGSAASASNGSQSAPAQTPPANDMVAMFLPALVKGANGDMKVLAESLAGIPQLKHLTVDSPEVRALLMAEAVPA